MLERVLLKAMQADLILNFIVSRAVMADSLSIHQNVSQLNRSFSLGTRLLEVMH